MTSAAVVHDVLKPAGTFPDLKHLQGKSNTNIALDFHLRRGDVDGGFAAADHVFEHTFRTQQVLHLPLEPFVSVGEPTDCWADHPHRVAIAVVRAHRDRAPARLAGEQGAGEGAVSRRRLRRQALHQAGSAGGGARADRAAAGENLADDGRAVLHAHQARHDVPHQERRSRTDASPRAPAKCSGTAAPTPISARASRRSRASPRPGPTTSRMSASTAIRSTPTCRRPARCAVSAFRNWSGPTRATPT